MTRHISTSALDFSNKDVLTQAERGVHVAAGVRGAPAFTDRARYPSINSRASCRADSSAGTDRRCDAADAPSAQTGVALEKSTPGAAAGLPFADFSAHTPRPHFLPGFGPPCFTG